MMKPHISDISAPQTPPTLLGLGILALLACFMPFQLFFLNHDCSALRDSAFLSTKSSIAFKLVTFNLKEIAQQ